jgi:hypothetical protein
MPGILISSIYGKRCDARKVVLYIWAFCLDTKKRERGWRQPAYRRPALHHACPRTYELVLQLILFVSADLSVCSDGSKV